MRRLRAEALHVAGRVVTGERGEVDQRDGAQQPRRLPFLFTVRRVGIVAARRSTAERFTRSMRTMSRSSGVPGLRST